jgi:AcrR family transcriptional regulator
MTRRRRATREDWLAALMSVLDAGRDPSKISILELGKRLSVTTGSFYNHFPGGRAELDAALISQWKQERIAALPDTSVGTVHDPLDRLRMIRTATAVTAVRDSAMRRRAAFDQSSAAAVAEADGIITSYLGHALADLGLTGRGPASLAGWLLPGLEFPPLAADKGSFETVLEILARAAVAQGGPVVGAVAEGDAVVLFTVGRELQASQRMALQRLVRALAAGEGEEELVSGQEEVSGREEAEVGEA